jgi:esterase/lipase
MKKAIILIHGFMTDPTDFDPIMDDLRKHYDYVRRFKLPGHGKDANHKLFTKEATIRYIEDEFDKVAKKYDHIDVMGFSLGGALGTYLSSIRSFDKLVLLAPANKYLSPFAGLRRVMQIAKKVKDEINVEDKKLTKIQKEHLSILNQTIKDVVSRDAKLFKFAIDEVLPRYTHTAIYHFVRTIKVCNKTMSKIKNPTLIVWGYLDEIVPKSAATYDYERCVHPDRKLVVLENIGHMMFRSEQIKELKEVVLEFLTKGESS